MIAPKLRFKEFTNEWKQKLFKELYDIKNGLNKEKEAFGSGTPIVNYMDVNKNTFIDLDDIQGRVNLNESEIKRFIVKNNDLFFTRTSETSEEIGLTCAYTGENTDLVFSGFVLKASPKLSNIDSIFYSYYLRTFDKRREIIKHSSITTRALTSGSLLSTISVSFPSLQEQNKIADFFIKWDKLIQLQKEKINLLKEQKKGYIQKIFSREIRFKDKNGNDYPEWTSNLLEHLGTFGTSYSFSRAIEGYGEYCHVHYGDIHSKLPTVCENFIFPSITEKRDFELINENDILFADASEDYADLGKAIIIKTMKSQNLIAGLHTHKFTAKEKLNPLYFIYFTQTRYYKEFVKKMGTGVSVLGISKSNLKKLEVPLPSIEEQRKISGLFYAFDKKIAAETEKIREIHIQKQSFIQQMFI